MQENTKTDLLKKRREIEQKFNNFLAEQSKIKKINPQGYLSDSSASQMSNSACSVQEPIKAPIQVQINNPTFLQNQKLTMSVVSKSETQENEQDQIPEIISKIQPSSNSEVRNYYANQGNSNFLNDQSSCVFDISESGHMNEFSFHPVGKDVLLQSQKQEEDQSQINEKGFLSSLESSKIADKQSVQARRNKLQEIIEQIKNQKSGGVEDLSHQSANNFINNSSLKSHQEPTIQKQMEDQEQSFQQLSNQFEQFQIGNQNNSESKSKDESPIPLQEKLGQDQEEITQFEVKVNEVTPHQFSQDEENELSHRESQNKSITDHLLFHTNQKQQKKEEELHFSNLSMKTEQSNNLGKSTATNKYQNSNQKNPTQVKNPSIKENALESQSVNQFIEFFKNDRQKNIEQSKVLDNTNINLSSYDNNNNNKIDTKENKNEFENQEREQDQQYEYGNNNSSLKVMRNNSNNNENNFKNIANFSEFDNQFLQPNDLNARSALKEETPYQTNKSKSFERKQVPNDKAIKHLACSDFYSQDEQELNKYVKELNSPRETNYDSNAEFYSQKRSEEEGEMSFKEESELNQTLKEKFKKELFFNIEEFSQKREDDQQEACRKLSQLANKYWQRNFVYETVGCMERAFCILRFMAEKETEKKSKFFKMFQIYSTNQQRKRRQKLKSELFLKEKNNIIKQQFFQQLFKVCKFHQKWVNTARFQFVAIKVFQAWKEFIYQQQVKKQAILFRKDSLFRYFKHGIKLLQKEESAMGQGEYQHSLKFKTFKAIKQLTDIKKKQIEAFAEFKEKINLKFIKMIFSSWKQSSQNGKQLQADDEFIPITISIQDKVMQPKSSTSNTGSSQSSVISKRDIEITMKEQK